MTIRAVYIDTASDEVAPAPFSSCASPDFEGRVTHSIDEARRWIDDGGVDVVIADLTTREDPVNLLSDTAIRHPEIGRLAIGVANGMAPAAHQWLTPPFDADTLRVHLLTTVHLRDRVAASTLLKLSDGSVKLPTLPDVYLRIQEALRSENASVTRVGEVIKEDPAISIKVLQIVNSSLYGLRTEIGDIPHAASLLGINTLTALVLAVGVFKQAEGLDRRYMEELWRGSITTSALARKIAQAEDLSRAEVESTQLAGLIHDLGDLVMIRNWREKFAKVRAGHRDEDERSLFGATHADLGGYLCAMWGLPSAVIGAVAHHHHPGRIEHDAIGPATIVHVARGLVDAGMNPGAAALDRQHLDRLGIAHRVNDWASLIA